MLVRTDYQCGEYGHFASAARFVVEVPQDPTFIAQLPASNVISHHVIDITSDFGTELRAPCVFTQPALIPTRPITAENRAFAVVAPVIIPALALALYITPFSIIEYYLHRNNSQTMKVCEAAVFSDLLRLVARG